MKSRREPHERHKQVGKAITSAAAVAGIAATLAFGAGVAGVPPPPLIGAAYTHYNVQNCLIFGTGIIDRYDRRGVRPLVQRQLAAMRASGLRALRLIVWYQENVMSNWGELPSDSGRLVEPFRANLIHFLHDVRAAGFKHLVVEFSPMWTSNPFPEWNGNHFVNRYVRKTFETNWQFVRDTSTVLHQYGPPSTWIDPLVEGAPSTTLLQVAGVQIRRYLAEMYRRYVDTFGASDIFISSIGPPEPGGDTSRRDTARRLQNLLDILRSTGRPLPRVFAVDLPNWRVRDGDVLYSLRQIDATLAANDLPQPIMITETIYDDAEIAHEIERFRRHTSRPLLAVLEWPRNRTQACRPGLALSPPYEADSYIWALTGSLPSRTLTGSVRARGRIALRTAYGQRATALRAGSYTIVVHDLTPAAGFHLRGPGLQRATSRRFTGTVRWTANLTPGAYQAWSGSPDGRSLVLSVL